MREIDKGHGSALWLSRMRER